MLKILYSLSRHGEACTGKIKTLRSDSLRKILLKLFRNFNIWTLDCLEIKIFESQKIYLTLRSVRLRRVRLCAVLANFGFSYNWLSEVLACASHILREYLCEKQFLRKRFSKIKIAKNLETLPLSDKKNFKIGHSFQNVFRIFSIKKSKKDIVKKQAKGGGYVGRFVPLIPNEHTIVSVLIRY